MTLWAAAGLTAVWGLWGFFSTGSDDSLRLLGRLAYPIVIGSALASGAFWIYRSAAKGRVVIDDEGVILRRDPETRLYWKEITQVVQHGGGKVILVTAVGSYSFDRFDCSHPREAGRLIAERKGIEIQEG